jgi:hypothetical protein
MSAKAKVEVEAKPIRLDLGCGRNKRKDGDWIGVDSIDFGQEITHDLTTPWPWESDSVDEAHCSHFVEHLTGAQRVHFANELFRVMKVGAKCQLIVPYYASERAYGDVTHQWPPVVGFWFSYLSREWRLGDPDKGIPGNAPHDDITHNPRGYSCDFKPGTITWGYSMHPAIVSRPPDYQQYALQWYREAAQDMIATLTKT